MSKACCELCGEPAGDGWLAIAKTEYCPCVLLACKDCCENNDGHKKLSELVDSLTEEEMHKRCKMYLID